MTTEREEGSLISQILQNTFSTVDQNVSSYDMIDFKNRYFPFSVIDFVAPYFDQSGISILLRKKKRETNVFKFLSVLKPEVRHVW